MKYFIVLLMLLIPQISIAQEITALQSEEATSYVHGINSLSIRLLVLKHSYEQMASDDATLAVQAVNIGSSKGLNIRSIGNHFVDKDGKRVALSQSYDLPNLKRFVSEQMKIGAESGDTLIIFTIGHGFQNGGLDNLGQREGLMTALAEAAEENDQETLWWQLSCFACMNLPKISSLNSKQQDLFSIVSSSDNTVSYAQVQGKRMEKIFIALAENNEEIDPNKDESITAKELANFMNSRVERGSGDLVFAKSENEVIFGIRNWANMIPIRDRNNPQGRYPKNYIPLPKR